MTTEHEPNDDLTAASEKKSLMRPKPLPIYLILLALSIALIFFVGPPASIVIVIALVVAGIIVLIDHMELRLPDLQQLLPPIITNISLPAPVSSLIHRLRLIQGSLIRRRAGLAALFMAFALIAMALCAQSALPSSEPFFNFTVPILWMLIGLGFLWASLYCAAPLVKSVALANASVQQERTNLLLTALGILLLFAVGEASGKFLGIKFLDQLPVAYQALPFYGGIIALVMGLSGVRRITLDSLRFPRSWRSLLTDPRKEFVLILVIFLASLLIRAWRLDTGLRASLDEALAVDGVGHYYNGKVGLVAPPSQYITTLLFPQWQGILMNILGRTVMVLRLTSAIIGAITVIVTYFLARDLFDDRLTGIVAALFLMTFPPHVHFSRVSLLHIADPLFGTLAIWFIIRGIRWNRRLDWAIAGAALGLTQYFFEAGRFFYLPLVTAWLGAVVALIILLFILKRLHRLPVVGRFVPGWQAALPRIPVKGGVFITVVAFIFVALPTYYAVASLKGDASPRLAASGGFSLFTDPLQEGLTQEDAVVLVRRVFFPFSVYIHQPEISVYYGGDQPLILVYVIPFFLLGIGYLLWRWRSPAFIIALWILATGGINALLRDSAVYTRWIVVLPGIAVVVAVAVRYLLPVLLSRGAVSLVGKTILVYRRQSFFLVAAVLGFMMVAQLNYYFNYHVPLLEKQVRLSKPYGDVFDLAIRSFDFPNATDIYIIGDPVPDVNVPRTWIGFFTKSDWHTLNYYPLSSMNINSGFIQRLLPNRNAALFIDPSARATIEFVQAQLGCTMQHSPYPIDPPEKEFLLCFAPARSMS